LVQSVHKAREPPHFCYPKSQIWNPPVTTRKRNPSPPYPKPRPSSCSPSNRRPPSRPSLRLNDVYPLRLPDPNLVLNIPSTRLLQRLRTAPRNVKVIPILHAYVMVRVLVHEFLAVRRPPARCGDGLRNHVAPDFGVRGRVAEPAVDAAVAEVVAVEWVGGAGQTKRCAKYRGESECETQFKGNSKVSGVKVVVLCSRCIRG
jgi:hypothetical protein